MTYNLKLTERQFNILLDEIDNEVKEGLGISEVLPFSENEEFDNDIINIDFMDFLNYYNAYLLKVKCLNKEEFHNRCNVHALVKSDNENENWIDEFEEVAPNGWSSIRKKSDCYGNDIQ